MSNILHEIKHGFLILGFTGPLSSGCTTAAEFFAGDIGKYIQDRYNRMLPKLEREIPQYYREIAALKRDLAKLLHEDNASLATSIKKQKLEDDINAKWSRLKANLDLRETLTVLKDYESDNFYYLSMTDMLLKCTIEAFLYSGKNKLSSNLSKMKSLIDLNRINKKRLARINKLISDRDLLALTARDFDYFESYLTYIREYKNALKKEFASEELGALLQDLGDNARRCGCPLDYQTCFDSDNATSLFIIANEANNVIKFLRAVKRRKLQKKIYKKFAIEAFRNPYEVEFFRNRYYEFYLLSIYAPHDIRKGRTNWTEYRDKRDQGVDLDYSEFYKQNVRGCAYLADIAVNNSTNKIRFERELAKYLALIRRPGCISPSDDELFMQQAYSMSVKSICISRQVGAVIIGPKGYIVGAGWNDVSAGQIGCGFRRYSDLCMEGSIFPVAPETEEAAFRDYGMNKMHFNRKHSFCYKDMYSDFKSYMKASKLLSSNDLMLWKKKYDVNEEAAESLVQIIRVGSKHKKLEYCRALHAEENAILQTAIIGGAGIRGGTIYTTTFPCELCAKKIYQSGIKRVVYTEPYPESISEEVFFKDGKRTIDLIQFEGVKSHSYYRLFKATIDKKEFQFQELN